MELRIAVAGCREYCDYEEAKAFLDLCLNRIKPEGGILFLSGGCRGADALGERYAKEKGFPIEKHPPDWKRYGKAAGPKRNEDIAKTCDLLICFWDGKSKGTASIISLAKKQNKPIQIKEITLPSP